MNSDIQTYFDAIPESRKEKLDTLHNLIIEKFPDAIVDMH